MCTRSHVSFLAVSPTFCPVLRFRYSKCVRCTAEPRKLTPLWCFTHHQTCCVQSKVSMSETTVAYLITHGLHHHVLGKSKTIEVLRLHTYVCITLTFSLTGLRWTNINHINFGEEHVHALPRLISRSLSNILPCSKVSLLEMRSLYSRTA